MKKVLMMMSAVSIAAALQFGLPVQASADHEHRGEKRMLALTEKLKLNDSQKKTVEAAFKEKGDKMKALHEDFNKKRKAIDEETEQKIVSSLTSQQKIDYAAMKAEREKRRDEREEHRDRDGDDDKPRPE